MIRQPAVGAMRKGSAACTAFGAVEKGIALGAVEKETALGAMEVGGPRQEKQVEPPLSMPWKRGTAARQADEACAVIDNQALGPPSAVRERERSLEFGRFQPRPPPSLDLRPHLSFHCSLSATPLVREEQPAAANTGSDVRT
eukprot:1084614-Pleurochrysis_carterae.AAC.1